MSSTRAGYSDITVSGITGMRMHPFGKCERPWPAWDNALCLVK